MTERARTTVVVPCFNDGKTLPAALASARRQPEPIELIVVDDGSDDAATRAVLSAVQGEGVTVIRQDNRGPPAARMEGVAAARTEYVFDLDADDVLAAGALAQLADALDREPGAACAWGDYRPMGRFRPARITARALDPWVLTFWNPLPVSALFRRGELLAVGGWSFEHGYEDWDLWMAFAERGLRGVHVPALTFYYRLDGGRRYARDLERHEDVVAQLRERHVALYERRDRTDVVSDAPWLARRLFPSIERARLSPRTKRLLYGALLELSPWTARQRAQHAVACLKAGR